MSTYDPIALGVSVGLDAIRADAEQAPPQPRPRRRPFDCPFCERRLREERAAEALTNGINGALQTLAQDGAE